MATLKFLFKYTDVQIGNQSVSLSIFHVDIDDYEHISTNETIALSDFVDQCVSPMREKDKETERTKRHILQMAK